MSIDSGFAILDVKRGRADLRRRTQAGERVPVTITGYVACAWGKDDGISQEFQVDVVSAVEAPLTGVHEYAAGFDAGATAAMKLAGRGDEE